MLEIFYKGGWMMLPLAVCSFVALTVVIDRALYFRRIHARPQAQKMLSLITQQKFADALALAEQHGAPLLKVLAAGVLERQADPAQAMEAVGIEQVTSMKRGLIALDTIITLAPLLGLLGTIIGMIQSFQVMAQTGLGQPHAVTGGVAEALIATATGISVAVVALIPYNYFSERVAREVAAIEAFATRAEAALRTTGQRPS